MTIQDIIGGLEQKKNALHQNLDNLLSQESPELIQEEMIRRDELKGECTKVYNKVKDNIADMEALCRKIREIKGDLTHDNKKLDTIKWSLIQSRKTYGA